MFKGKILIHGIPRSSTTTIQRMVEDYLIEGDARIVNEPFHWSDVARQRRVGGERGKLIAGIDPYEVDKICELLYHVHPPFYGAKNVECLLPFCEEVDNWHEKILFLSRRNVLKAAVSFAIASQTRIWNWRNIPAEKIVELTSLKETHIEQLIGEWKTASDLWLELSEGNHLRYLFLYYEDLWFDGPENLVIQFKKIRKLMYGEEWPEEPWDQFLSAVTKRGTHFYGPLNTEEAYRGVHNIREINEIFGDEKTGFLFEDS